MSYISLYRRFRPLKYSEMVGQEHITRTLRNQIIANRVGHAYLFNGGRGTGKTTVAKILARAINCLNPKDGEPCNECEICKSMLDGSLTDIVEMDAASNNSVEDIRAIREEVNFLPTLAKYRVYIIDEVHMLSTGAFNALLKTLEEPPQHVKFILATTEPQKLPATILSRCQRFDFKTISETDIIKRLKIVCKEADIEITEEALNTIAAISDGAMRDGLSILERCIQDEDTNIDDSKVKELIGIPQFISVHKIVEAIVNENVDNVIQALNDVLQEGKDISNLLWEIIKYTNDILLFKATKEAKLYNKNEIESIKQLSEKISKERLLNIIYQLSELENNLKWSSQKKIMLEIGLIKLCTEPCMDEVQELNNRITRLEEKIKDIGNIAIPVNQNIQKNSNVSEKKVNIDKAKEKQEKVMPVSNKANTNIVKSWNNIIDGLKSSGKIMLYTNLINTIANQINDMTVGIEFPNGITAFGKTVLEKPENKQEIERLISMQYGKTMNIKYIDKREKNKEENNTSSIEKFAKELDIPIQISED